MKSEKKYYVVAWIIAVAVFHLVVLIMPDKVLGPEKTNFWVIYLTVMASFIGQAVCSLIYAKREKKQERFLLIPVVIISYIALLMTLLLALQAIALQFLPDWFTIMVAILVLAYYALAVLRTLAAADMIMEIEERVSNQTSLIRTLTTRANTLESSATEELRPLVKKIQEELRYSDPVSMSNMVDIEVELKKTYDLFASAVNAEVKDAAKKEAAKLSVLLKERNELCRLSK